LPEWEYLMTKKINLEGIDIEYRTS
jgi:hypothetical protein